MSPRGCMPDLLSYKYALPSTPICLKEFQLQINITTTQIKCAYLNEINRQVLFIGKVEKFNVNKNIYFHGKQLYH